MTFSQNLERIKDQEWFQQLSNAFNQLSPEQQKQAKWASIIGLLFLGAYLIYSVSSTANSVKTEYFEKQELAQLLNNANDELRRLRGQNVNMAQGSPQSWKEVFTSLIQNQGLPADAVEILKESPGATQSMIQESVLEVKVKSIQIRPLVQLLFAIEHGTPPMKLKGMSVESQTNEGTLQVKLNISGYMPKPEKTDKK